MLEDHDFCDNCPGCRPALMDTNTGEFLGSDSPVMQVVNRIWDCETTFNERKAFIEVTLHNSEDIINVGLFKQVSERIQKALHDIEKK